MLANSNIHLELRFWSSDEFKSYILTLKWEISGSLYRCSLHLVPFVLKNTVNVSGKLKLNCEFAENQNNELKKG